jgi:hypothetical protein
MGAQSDARHRNNRLRHTVILLLLVLMYMYRGVLGYRLAMFELGGLATVFAESARHSSSLSGKEKRRESGRLERLFLLSAPPAEVGARLNGFWDRVDCRSRSEWVVLVASGQPGGYGQSLRVVPVARRLPCLVQVFGGYKVGRTNIWKDSGKGTRQICQLMCCWRRKDTAAQKGPLSSSGAKRREECPEWILWC